MAQSIEYKIYLGLYSDKTETTYPQSLVLSILDKYLEVYTITKSTGSWKGVQEPSLIITIISDHNSLIQQIAYDLKSALQQEAVLLTFQAIQTQLI